MDGFLPSDHFKLLLLALPLLLMPVLRRVLFPPKPDSQYLRARSSSCGWTGTVGRCNRRCSRCASTALEPARG